MEKLQLAGSRVVLSHSGPLLHKTQLQPLSPEGQGIPLPLNFQALMTSTSPKKILRSAKILFAVKDRGNMKFSVKATDK